jgi:cellulose synthase/poly-beta-1,6-N-acetylglucosamine synthase-like glycosyltransferase
VSNQAAAPSVGRIAASTAAITVSVVIPVRNGARYLRRTLPVLRRELPAGWEIVVVNDHSSDDSADVARQFADRVLLSPVDGNGMDARNAGVTAARRPPSSSSMRTSRDARGARELVSRTRRLASR